MERLQLTLAQRYRFDAHGYVLLKGVLTPEEVEALKAALYRMAADPDLEAKRVYTRRRGEHHTLFGHLVEYDPAFLSYAVHPGLVPLVEEVVGGAVRLEESEAIINRRDPHADPETLFRRRTNPTGFHTGARPTWGCYYERDRFHCLFVKALAYLTDVGPDDGGTTLIPGSHRTTWPQREMIAAVEEDESLVHQVEAQAGDVLLFPESLIHSSTAIRSDRERLIVVSGYTPPMLREWMGNEISPEFVAGLPEEIRPLISGSDNWNWRRNY
jgi:phytanoyl-CoA dioxygenase PhyH